MASSGTYYMNGDTLLSSSTVFLDEAMTLIAPTGYYSDGTWVRLQLDGVLMPPVPCPACLPPCNSTINAHGNLGEYVVSMDVGGTESDTGAILIRFEPFNIPDGILALYNGVYYNGVCSPAYGYLVGDLPYLPTFVGQQSSNCNLENSYFDLPIYSYVNGSFVPTGNTETIYVPSGQVKLTTNPPGSCLMVIPKVAATPNILKVTFYGACGGTKFDVSVGCPVKLTSFAGSVKATTQYIACSYTLTQNYFNAPVNGTAGVVGLYDLVFADANGWQKLAAGYYKFSGNSNYNVMQVDSHGVVVALAKCA